LRFLPNNVDLWLEYVKLEVGWVEALRRRWKVLGILDEVVGGVKQEVDDARDIEGGEGFETNPAIENEDGMEEDEGKGAFGAGGEDARKRLTNGDLILTVLKNSFGRSGLKDNLSYRLRLLELFRDYPSGLRSRLLKAVYESMRSSQTLVKDCTARRIWIEAELFDAKYDPNVSDEIEQPAGYAPIEGEGKRVVLHGEALVLAIAKVVKGLKGKQEIESALEATELSQWRAQWEETVGLWLLRWTSRTQGNDDLVCPSFFNV
jgi:U3 small nucleolar RNA-associated protein 6